MMTKTMLVLLKLNVNMVVVEPLSFNLGLTFSPRKTLKSFRQT